MQITTEPAVINHTVVQACSRDSAMPILQISLRHTPFDDSDGGDITITCSFDSDTVLDEFVRQVTQAACLAKGAAAKARTQAARVDDDKLTAAAGERRDNDG